MLRVRARLLLAAYTATVAGVGAVLGDRVLLVALPLLAVAPLAGGLSSWWLVLVAMVFVSSVKPVYYVAMLPALLLAPLAYGRPPYRAPPALVEMLHLGPAGLRVLAYTLLLLVAALVEPNVAPPLLTVALAVNVYGVYGYARLGRAVVRLLHAPRRLVWGSRGRLRLHVDVQSPVWVLVSVDGRVYRFSVDGSRVVEVPVEAEKLGDRVAVVKVYLYTVDGLSQRLAVSTAVRFRVVPLTVKAVERLSSRVLPRLEWASTGRLEAVLYEHGGGGRVRRVRGLVVAGRGDGVGVLLEELYLAVAGRGGAAGARRSRVGEYLGARLYVPGDDPRLIHWKKTVSRGELVVREHGVAGAAGGLGGAGRLRVVVVDLAASMARELDAVVHEAITRLTEVALADPSARLVLVLHYGGRFLVLKGPVVDVLRELALHLAERLPSLLYQYPSLAAEPPETVLKSLEAWASRAPGSLVAAVGRSLLGYAEAVTGLLRLEGVAGGTEATLIHGRSTLVRNTVLRRRLGALGLRARAAAVTGVREGLGEG